MTIRIVEVDATQAGVIATLRRLQLATLSGDRPFDVRKGYWWLAYESDKPVGFCGVVQSRQWWDAGYLCRSGVIATHRGQGLQRRLIRARERKARAIGWRWLISDTFQNPASSNSLIGCGYRIYAPSAPWGFKGAIYWRKRINE